MKLRLSLSGESTDGLSGLPFEGIGLLRGEFILRERCESLRLPAAAEALQRYLDRVATEFAGRDVWYRLADLWSDEAATLAGSPARDPEHNPILGEHGIRRGLADRELLELELALFVEVARDHPKLHLLTPFTQDATEFTVIAELAASAGHPNRIGSMLEIPSAVLDAAAFARAGASNLFVGLNDLSCLVLGRDRGPKEMKLHPTLWRLIEGIRADLPANFEWGIGGSLDQAVLQRARAVGVPYACVHYADASALLGIPSGALPDGGHVRRVKGITARAKNDLGLRGTALAPAMPTSGNRP